MNEYEEDDIEVYIKWINENIKKYNDISTILDRMTLRSDTALFELDKVQAKIPKARIGISGEKSRLLFKKRTLERSFNIWWAEKFNIERRTNNTDSKAGAKWISKTELEYLTISNNKQQYSIRKKELDDLDSKMDFYSILMKDADIIINVVQGVSNNIRKEMDYCK